MRARSLGALAALFLASAGATQARTLASKPPTAVFDRAPAETVQRIVDACARDDEAVVARGTNAVSCEIPLGRPERIAARFLLLEPFVRTPRAFVRFTVAPTETGTSRVEASAWVEDSRPPRDRRVVAFGGARFGRRMQDFLSGAGGVVRPA